MEAADQSGSSLCRLGERYWLARPMTFYRWLEEVGFSGFLPTVLRFCSNGPRHKGCTRFRNIPTLVVVLAFRWESSLIVCLNWLVLNGNFTVSASDSQPPDLFPQTPAHKMR